MRINAAEALGVMISPSLQNTGRSGHQLIAHIRWRRRREP